MTPAGAAAAALIAAAQKKTQMDFARWFESIYKNINKYNKL